jgi:hypothetical protein
MVKVKILWPEERSVPVEQLITWAKDDVENGLCSIPGYTTADDVKTLEDAANILRDTGSVTFARRPR